MPPTGMPLPDPWLMGVVAIGASVVLWWLTPDTARRDEEVSRSVWGRLSPHRRWPRAARRYQLATGYLGAVSLVVLGVALLVGAATARI